MTNDGASIVGLICGTKEPRIGRIGNEKPRAKRGSPNRIAAAISPE
jgi:hypothetical protein